MKVTFIEHDGCFSVELRAETMTDAAQLTRFGMNRTEEIRSCHSYAQSNGEFFASIVLGKSKRANNDVPRRK